MASAPCLHNFVLKLAYDGTSFLGWHPGIEAILKEKLETLLQHPVRIQAASRTDKGVHAKEQVVNVFSYNQLNIKALRSMLPKAITLLDCTEKEIPFHPTLAAKGKEYHYFVCNGMTQLPWHRHTSWHVPYPLTMSAMEEAAHHLIGTHDFAAFCNQKQGEVYTDTVRTIRALTINPLEENRLCFKIEGTSFLYKMVRNIVGTLVYVGRGKMETGSLPSLLRKKDRTQIGVCAPACGLFLTRVFYD